MSSNSKKPNIILIIADDVGYGDPRCYNPAGKIPTPNIDRLAAEGIRLTDAHAPAAICTPSRYGALTGRYCWRSALPYRVLSHYEPPIIEADRLTLASMLKPLGYATACVGKWHLGLHYRTKPGETFDFTKPLPWDWDEPVPESKIDFHQPVTGGPTALGFDYFFGTSGISTMSPPYGFIENERFIDPPSVYFNDPSTTGGPGRTKPGMMSASWDRKEVDPIFARHAVRFVQNQAESAQPFFLYLASSSPHEPCSEDVVPEFARGQSQAGPRGDLVWLYDWMVGQVLDTLERTGQADNTLVMVTSDHGALLGDRTVENGQQVWHTYGHKSCGDWRGQKAHIWEGGHRIPFVARWPRHIPAGSVNNELFCLTDLMETLAGLLEIELPENAAEDSLNLLPVLLGRPHAQPIRDSVVYHTGMNVYGIRRGNWKCIPDTLGSGGWPPPTGTWPVPGSPGQLYNLKEDPGEQNNLWASHPEIVAALTQLLNEQKQADRTAPHRRPTSTPER
jgi:arylsulfatase A